MRASGVSRGFLIRYGLISFGLLLLWYVGAYVVLPRVVRAAYDGTSIGFLNGLISGRDVHPVERYLDVVARFNRLGTVGLLVAIPGLLAAWALRDRLVAGWREIARRGPTGSATRILEAGAGIGLTFGVLESTTSWLRFRATGYVSTVNNPDVLWMAPLALATLFATLAFLLYFVLRGRRLGMSYRLVVGICSTIGVYGMLRGLRTGLHPIAIWVVALGIGVQLGRLFDRQRPRRLARRAVLPVAGLALALGVVSTVSERLREGRLQAALPDLDGPNVLLIVLDTVRGESLGLYGYDRPTTPHLDRRAESGVIFDRAIAPAPWTLPTHASFFTGHYPHELTADWETPLDESYPTLAEFLGERGYATGGFVANQLYTNRLTGLDRGFQRYSDYPVSFETWILSTWATRSLALRVWRWLPTSREFFGRKYAAEVNEEFLAWIDGVDRRPFFGFLNYFDAHEPYETHQEFLGSVVAGSPPRRVLSSRGAYEEADFELTEIIDGYDSSIAYMDQSIDELFSGLSERGMLENTIIILTGDHGEQLGDRGLTSHGNSLYSQLLHVPLVIWGPFERAGPARVPEPVSLRDIPATVASLAGLDASAFPGHSLERFWESPGLADSAPVLSELSVSPLEDEGPIRNGDMKSIVEGSLHYVLNGDGVAELYDLDADPREDVDLAETATGAAEASRLHAVLQAILAEGADRR